ncbi:hypothetical protein [Burkholderia phage vB_BpP_HN03]
MIETKRLLKLHVDYVAKFEYAREHYDGHAWYWFNNVSKVTETEMNRRIENHRTRTATAIFRHMSQQNKNRINYVD